jgi:starch-binding outer membrane protein, SusD/RagB family
LKKSLLITAIVVLFSLNTFSSDTDTLYTYLDAQYLLLKDYSVFGVNEWAFGDVYSDDSQAGGDLPMGTDLPPLQSISRYEVDECNDYIRRYWLANYSCINYSNAGIKLISRVGGIEQEKAEFKFFRALCYFNLVKVYGDVPLLIEPFIPDSIKIPRSTTFDVWALIESDLKEAASILPVNVAIGDERRPTQGAANAMLTKAYIYQKKWNSALVTAEKIINSERYSLESNYQSNFRYDKEYGPESIFEIEQVDNPPVSEAPWGTNAHDILMNPRKVIVRGIQTTYTGWGFNCPTPNFVDEFEEGDPRLKYTVAQKGDSLPYSISGNDTTWAIIDVNYASPTGKYSRKYEMHPFEHDGDNYLPLNIKVIRYADVLLWAAEAAFNLGSGYFPKALNYVNMIRTRARISGTSGQPINLTAITMNAIIHERRVELGLEGHRFFDLQRYFKAEYLNLADIIHNSGKPNKDSFRIDKNLLFPIPMNAIYNSGGILTQNPGYGSDLPYSKEDTAKIALKYDTSPIILSDYFGCKSGAIPGFAIITYSKNPIDSLELHSDSLIITYREDATGVNYINLNVDCDCPIARQLFIEVSALPPKINDAINKCPGSMADLSVANTYGLSKYFWYEDGRKLNDIDRNQISVKLSWKSYTVKDEYYGFVSEPVKITWNTMPDDTIPTIYSGGGPEVYYLATDAKADSFQWYLSDQSITGANKYYYVAYKDTGTYCVKIKQNGRECAVYSKTEKIDINSGKSCKDDISDKITIFPNPAQDELHISIDDDYLGPVTIRIVDITGRSVFNTIYKKADPLIKVDIPLDGFNTGYYILEVNSHTTSKLNFLKQ